MLSSSLELLLALQRAPHGLHGIRRVLLLDGMPRIGRLGRRGSSFLLRRSGHGVSSLSLSLGRHARLGHVHGVVSHWHRRPLSWPSRPSLPRAELGKHSLHRAIRVHRRLWRRPWRCCRWRHGRRRRRPRQTRWRRRRRAASRQPREHRLHRIGRGGGLAVTRERLELHLRLVGSHAMVTLATPPALSSTRWPSS